MGADLRLAAGRLGDASRVEGPGVGRAVTGSANVLLNQRPALRVGDRGVHRARGGNGEWEAEAGAPRVLINGSRVVRIGDPVHDGRRRGKMVQGSPNVLVGNHVAGERTQRFATKMLLTDMPGPAGVPLMHARWSLFLGDRLVEEGETDATGKLAIHSTLEPNRAYELRYPGRTVEIVAGAGMDVTTVKGQQLRLAFLGYHPGPATGHPCPAFEAALRELQIDNQLDVDGVCGLETQGKLSSLAGW